jgi:RNA polymerase sigma-70 factor (ECF subfamily)
MNKGIGAPALGFSMPGQGIFMPPLSITMSFPNANRLTRQRTAEVEGEPATEETHRPQEQSEPVASGQSELSPVVDSAQSASTASSADLDRQAVVAALQGDQTAFADLVTRYQSAVFNMAYRMLGDPTEAEDAAQEVFVRAWNQLHTFQLERRFSTWLLSIASHYCIDVLRRRKPTAPLDDVALYKESTDPQPDEIALQGEQSRTVKELLNALPDKYRSVTVLRYYNDLSYDEIARATGLTESAVKTQLHRARRMLADLILKKGGAPHGMPDNL